MQPLLAPKEGFFPVIVCLHVTLDPGFTRLFNRNICARDINFGILDADFSSRHRLIVDVTRRQLTESIKVDIYSLASD